VSPLINASLCKAKMGIKRIIMTSGVARNMSWGVQYNIFALKALLLLHFLKKILKTPFYFGLGVRMPLCTSPGYATDNDI